MGLATAPAPTPDPSEKEFWIWYIVLVTLCAGGNLLILAYVWNRTKPSHSPREALLEKSEGAERLLNISMTGGGRSNESYKGCMRCLAVPWVWECAWRSVFPSLYLQRFVVWDTFLNSIIVDRCWACCGELSWTYQIALALRHIDTEVNAAATGEGNDRARAATGTWWIQLSGWTAFITYVVAECISYYNVATTNEFWAAAEVVVDGVSFILMAPGAIYLCYQLRGSSWTSGRIFCLVLAITCIAYPGYNWFVDAPMYMRRYAADEAANKTYQQFLPGLMDAATRRVVTRRTEDWKEDMTWMTCYFLFGAWSGILLMFAPTVGMTTRERKHSELRKLVVTWSAPL